MQTIGDHLERFVMNVLIIVACALVIIGFAQVFTRYLMDYSLYWSEEAMRYLFIWLVFLGMGPTLRHGGHVAVEVLISALKPKGRRRLSLLIMSLILLFCLVFTFFGAKIALKNINQLSAALRWSMGLVYLALPLGGLVSIFFALERITLLLAAPEAPETPDETPVLPV